MVLYQDVDKFCYEFTDFLSVLFRGCFEDWEDGVVRAANDILEFCRKEGYYVYDIEVIVSDKDSFMFAYAVKIYLKLFEFGSFTLRKFDFFREYNLFEKIIKDIAMKFLKLELEKEGNKNKVFGVRSAILWGYTEATTAYAIVYLKKPKCMSDEEFEYILDGLEIGIKDHMCK